MLSETLAAKLDMLPPRPGVYLFRGAEAVVLYVGKARKLRSRVRSYFQPSSSDMRYFVSLLGEQLVDIETIVVDTEKEATLLENQLIKEHRPRFNVKLRDDKEYLSLRLDPDRPWPRLEVVRRPAADGARYFGPYHSASAARKTLRLVNRYFRLRTCTDSELKSRTRACLQYQIRRCPGPCVFDVPTAEYASQVSGVSLFLDGRHSELERELEGRMARASKALDYERAAVHRDQLRAVQNVTQKQRVTALRTIDQDILGLYRQADQAEIALVMVRQGRVVEVRTFPLRDLALPDAEIFSNFLIAYYGPGTYIPHEIICPHELEAVGGISDAFSERVGRRVRILRPRRGGRAELLRLAMDNALHAFQAKLRARDDITRRLGAIQARLNLPTSPRAIECVDVSHHAGDDAVAVFIRLVDGAPHRSAYRSFGLKQTRAGDDYGAMHEALSRRLRRGRKGGASWVLPDLLVLDGGRGQLGVGLAALAALKVDSLPIVALAKERDQKGDAPLVDRIYLPGQKNAIPLHVDPALGMLALARDEAHRFSNDRRRRAEKKRKFQSPLEAIPGVGPRTKERLLTALGSMRTIVQANEGELVRAGATRRQAAAIWAAFHGSPQVEPSHEAGSAAQTAEDDALANAFDSTFPPPS